MKKKNYLLMAIALLAFILFNPFVACDKEEDVPDTTISLDITETDPMNVGDTLSVEVTIVAGDVVSLKYYKVADNVKSDAVDVTTGVVSDGNNHSYTFTYVLQDGDDLKTLGFEFEITDGKDLVNTVSVLVNTVLSVKSSFIKYDWKITGEDWLGSDVLAAHDAAKTFRFNEDGTYDVDLGADPAHLDLALHHYCFWIYKDTPTKQDTIAIIRLLRKKLSGEVGEDEYYDFRITSANESEMTMYWDLAFWGLLDIQRTFKSQPKGAFTPYGTQAKFEQIDSLDVLNCSTVDDALLTIDY